MGRIVGECSVMKEISKTEEAIKNCYERVNKLEDKLKTDQLPENKKNSIQTELLEVRKLLATNEEQLSNLHKDNQKSFMVVAAVCFICFTVYALYILVNGKDF